MVYAAFFGFVMWRLYSSVATIKVPTLIYTFYLFKKNYKPAVDKLRPEEFVEFPAAANAARFCMTTGFIPRVWNKM